MHIVRSQSVSIISEDVYFLIFLQPQTVTVLSETVVILFGVVENAPWKFVLRFDIIIIPFDLVNLG